MSRFIASFAAISVSLSATLLVPQASAQEVSDPVAELVLPEQIFPVLQPILRDAALQSPRALNANIEYLIAQETLITSRARLLPSIGGGGTYSQARDERLDNPDIEPNTSAKLSYSASISQPVYHWGALRAGYNAGKIAVKIAENNYAEAYRLLTLEIRSAYLRMVVAHASMNRAKFALRLAESEVKVAESKLSSGAISSADMFSPKLRYEEALLEADRSEEEFRFAKSVLERLAGVQEIPRDSIPTLIPNIAHKGQVLESLLTRFVGANEVENTFRVATYDLRAKQERLNYKVLNTNLRPKFNFVAGVSQDESLSGAVTSERVQTRSYYGGLNVGWTLFDGFATRAYRKASLMRIRQIESDKEALAKDIMELARNQLRLVEFAARQTSFSEARLSQLDGLAAFKAEDVKRGYTSQADADTVALARDDVLIYTMRSRIEYLARLSEFLSTIGRDPALVNAVPSHR